MVESNDIWGVIAYVWNWCRTTIWFEGEIFGLPIHWFVSDFYVFILIASFAIWIIRMIFFLIDD